MKLRKEVLERLLLAKSVLSPARNRTLGQPNAHLVARWVLNAHDASDLVFAAIADQKKKFSAKSRGPSMVECLELIGRPGNQYAAYFKQLNDARNSLKHAGNLPNTNQWATVGDDTFEKLSRLSQTTLRVSLDGVDESELLRNSDAQKHYRAAKRASESGDFKLALEEIGKALYVILDERFDLAEIEVGSGKAEDALKLTGFGISANDFLRMQEFLPRTTRLGSEPFKVTWRQNEFGHPGNWQADVVEFCLGAFLDVAFKTQDVPSVPYAVPFSYLYKHKITAEKDDVEIWEDFVNEQLEHEYGNGNRPFRVSKRFLKRGESITVSAFADAFVSSDQSLTGEWIRRVRVSTDPLSFLFPRDAKAEFVNLADVSVTCVPATHLGERFLDLPAIPWEDPDGSGTELSLEPLTAPEGQTTESKARGEA
jgi:hypothetical protein